MSEYKELTVGYWLSQLKEPLKSKAIGPTEILYHNEPCDSLKSALWRVAMETHSDKRRFWIGACDFFDGLGNTDLSSMAQEGWELAKQCAPDAADFPPPTELGENEDLTITFLESKWIHPDTSMAPLPEGGYVDAPNFPPVAAPAPEPSGFVKEVSKPLGLYMVRENGEKEIVRIPALSAEELLNLNENPIILPDETFLYPGDSPKPKDSWEVEKAVVGYEPPTPIELPKPIDTIEKKHELRIQALEAVEKRQDDELVELQGQIIDLVKIVKDMAVEMENLIVQVRALNKQVFNTHLD